MEKEEERRLYFVVRSWITLYISALILFGSVLILGSINFVQTLLISTLGFFVSLALSRLFDKQIEKIVAKVLNFLDKHEKTKNLIVKHF
jgi:hypothetical protein